MITLAEVFVGFGVGLRNGVLLASGGSSVSRKGVGLSCWGLVGSRSIKPASRFSRSGRPGPIREYQINPIMTKPIMIPTVSVRLIRWNKFFPAGRAWLAGSISEQR